MFMHMGVSMWDMGLSMWDSEEKKKNLHESFSPSTKGIIGSQVLSTEPSYHPSYKILDAPFNSSLNI